MWALRPSTPVLRPVWPDGYICKPCYINATHIHGTCAGCGEQRLLPGRDSGGSAICRDCAGIARSFDCRRCGAEGRLYYRKVCIRCRLADLDRECLDDGTGTVRPDLQPLVAVLAGRYKTPPEAASPGSTSAAPNNFSPPSRPAVWPSTTLP
jgi:hypothetical protein